MCLTFSIGLWLAGSGLCLAEGEIGWHGRYPFKPAPNGYKEGVDNQKVIKSYTKANEREILNSLRKLLAEYSRYPIMTYGASADMPQLKKAWARQRFPAAELQSILDRHHDINTFFRSSFRFPILSMGLKEIETYLGFKRRFNMDGFMALSEYYEYLNTKSQNNKERIKGRLMRYNLEDLEGTRFVANQMETVLQNCLDVN